MKKDFLILLLVIVIAIVLTIALLFSSRAVPEKQNPAIAKSVQTQIAERENFLEKIGASTDADITSSLERKNPLDVFEANLKPRSLPAIPAPATPTVSPPLALPSEPAIPADFNAQNVSEIISADWKVVREQ